MIVKPRLTSWECTGTICGVAILPLRATSLGTARGGMRILTTCIGLWILLPKGRGRIWCLCA